MGSSVQPFLSPEVGSQPFPHRTMGSYTTSLPILDPRHGKYYLPGESPFENTLIFSPFLDGLLAHLTTIDLLRFTNVSRTVRTYTYGHAPSFRVLNFVRFCQEGCQFLPNHQPHNGTNKLCNWEYNIPSKKYPYIDTNDWEYKFCPCHGYLGDERLGEGSCQREYYYNRLGSTGLCSLFKRLPEGMQLTVLILDGTGVRMRFVKDIFRSTWGGAWLRELSLRNCAKIEHSDVEKWLRKIFWRNCVHGLRVLKV